MSDTTQDRLAQIAQRVEAATEGTWAAHDFGYAGEDEPSSIVVHTGEFDHRDLSGEATTAITSFAWDGQSWENAEFIAHARTDIPAMHAALTAVLALHVSDGHTPDGCGGPGCWEGCVECTEPYPCRTRRAINDALGGE